MNFNDLPTTKRGDAGETIVDGYLTAKGCTLYGPGPGPHPIDRFMIDPTGRPFAFDVKTYPRQYSRAYTGIDLPDFYKYLNLSPVPVLLFFVDPFEGCIYVHTLNREDGHRAPMIENGKVYFHLSEMTLCRLLTVEELLQLGKIKQPERYARTRKHFVNLKSSDYE